MAQAFLQSQLPLPGRRQGKVRDVYDSQFADGAPALVIVASDRISAFDVVMPNGVPGKGIVLTQLSRFWFAMISKQIPALRHHLISSDPDTIPGLTQAQRAGLARRVMIGRKTKVVPIECVVRGYLAGSGWAEYQKTQSVCGVKLPPGLRQCEQLPQPIFTPATKEESGHDQNISFDRACELVGTELMRKMRDHSIAIYSMARDYAATRGIIIADTKFEFGLPLDPAAAQSGPILIDEVLTPDSSRFWPAADYAPGRDQKSYDKQFVRNYLEGLVTAGKWNKTPPGPVLPEDVIAGTLAKYLEAYEKLTGAPLKL